MPKRRQRKEFDADQLRAPKRICVCGKGPFGTGLGLERHARNCQTRKERDAILHEEAMRMMELRDVEGKPKHQANVIDQGATVFQDAGGTDTYPPVIEPEPEETGLRRSRRVRFRPRKLIENDPTPPPSPPPAVEVIPDETEFPEVTRRPVRTKSNRFNMYYIHTQYVLHMLEGNHADISPLEPEPEREPTEKMYEIIAPHENLSQFVANHWFWARGSTKSLADLKTLILLAKRGLISIEEIGDWNIERTNQRLLELGKDTVRFGGPWFNDTIAISVPLGHVSRDAPNAASFVVDGFYRRQITSIIISVFSNKELSKAFHYVPCEPRIRPPGAKDQCVFREIYESKRNRELHDEVQTLPRSPEDKLERAVVTVMIWSDGLSATNFGHRKLWPVYIQFGNQSKYERQKADDKCLHLVSLLPELPSRIQDWFDTEVGCKASPELLTFARRQLMQAAWNMLLDDEFINAWKEGIIVRCGDGILRRLYPRIVSYSADFPEKVLIASMKYLSEHPCPRCLILRVNIPRLGMKSDLNVRVSKKGKRTHTDEIVYNLQIAHDQIFESRRRVNAKEVESLLQKWSLAPVKNAFIERLGPMGFDLYAALTPDILHEWTGVWKALFMHLVRILKSYRPVRDVQLDQRVRQVPSFGEALRSRKDNASESKQMTAYQWANLLKAMPIFDGLLPQDYNKIVLDLLYVTGSLRAYASLGMHTESTVSSMFEMTKRFGDVMRTFQASVGAKHVVKETPEEYKTRLRRVARMNRSGQLPDTTDLGSHKKPIKKVLSTNTYTFHALADHPRYIMELGPLDSYSTSIGETGHKELKAKYKKTNKSADNKQITELNTRRLVLSVMYNELLTLGITGLPSQSSQSRPADQQSDLDEITGQRHKIGRDGQRIHLPTWLNGHQHDPACFNFLQSLLDFFVAHLRGDEEDIQYTRAERNEVSILGSKIEKHPQMTLYYTSYDMRREFDTINPVNKSDIMILPRNEAGNGDDVPRYDYARVIGIYHADVRWKRDGIERRIDFLHVRWFRRVKDHRFGDEALRLEQIRFIGRDEDDAQFGFVHPSSVIRAVHLAPVFAKGRTDQYMGQSALSRIRFGDDDDYAAYYVVKFIDSDHFMRHRGGGIGHTTPHGPRAFEVSETLYSEAGFQPSDFGPDIVIEEDVVDEIDDRAAKLLQQLGEADAGNEEDDTSESEPDASADREDED